MKQLESLRKPIGKHPGAECQEVWPRHGAAAVRSDVINTRGFTMCGVFGWVSRNGGTMDIKTMRKIAEVTESRGPDAYGIAWVEADGTMSMVKNRGRITENLSVLRRARNAVALIGHTRWATHGSPEDNRNNHPHPAAGGWYVHNGVIPGYRALIRRAGRKPRTECDSEAIGHLIETDEAQNKLDACVTAAAIIQSRPYVMLGLWGMQVIAVRNGNPLASGETKNGLFLASYIDYVPNGMSLEDRRGYRFTAKA